MEQPTQVIQIIGSIGGKGTVKSVNWVKPDKEGNVQIPAGVDVSGAAVGQMVIVKAVDENGKPTEWEAVDKPVHIANVRVDRGRYFFVDGNHETLLNAYNSGATVGLNVSGFLYYLANVDGDNNLHFGQIPYSNSESETTNIPNYYLMVAPDDSITQTVRSIATEGFVNQAIAESMPKKNRELLFDIEATNLVANNKQYNHTWSSDERDKYHQLIANDAEIEAEVIYSAYGTEYIATLANASKVVSGLNIGMACYDANWSDYNSINLHENGFTAKSAYAKLTRLRIYKFS